LQYYRSLGKNKSKYYIYIIVMIIFKRVWITAMLLHQECCNLQGHTA